MKHGTTDKAYQAGGMIAVILLAGIVIAILIILGYNSTFQATEGVTGGTEASFDLVEMNVSAYCPCEICCGEFADGITASGKPAVGLICAADPKYPFGTKMTVNGVTYTVEDRGGAIKGNKIDLLFPTHQSALNFGRQYLKVRYINEVKNEEGT